MKQFKQALDKCIKELGQDTRKPNVKRPSDYFRDQGKVKLHLAAYYAKEVEYRGHAFQHDNSTLEKLDLVSRWLVSSSHPGLILMGSYGNGKTTMLRAISKMLPYISRLANAQEIFDDYKQDRVNSKFWNEPILLIDDLGIEPPKCFNFGEEYKPITNLLLHRYDKQLTSIIATNLSLEEICERYSARVVDRMYETYTCIQYKEKSYR